MLTAGEYPNGVVVGSGLGTAKNGNEQILIKLKDEDSGGHITAYLATTENAWPYSAKKLSAAGWDPVANGYRFEELNAEPSPIAGNKVSFTVDTEADPNTGQLRHKVSWINAPGGSIERMEVAEARTFAAKLRQRLIGGGAPKPTHTAPKSTAPAGGTFSDGSPVDDDPGVPF